MSTSEAFDIESLLGKTFHVTVPDGRLFTGTFRCTDNEANIILSNAFEYRNPSPKDEEQAIAKSTARGEPVRADMTSRFVGLIVIPGKQIVKMEVEEKRNWPVGTAMPTRVKPQPITTTNII